MRKLLLLIFTSFIFAGCDREDDLFYLSTEDQLVIEKAYSKSYSYPDGFNYDANSDGTPYYENTVSIRASENSWVELHTNEKQQAKSWSEISSLTSAYYRDLVEERETDKFFEFKRVFSANPNDIILSRIHKSSYFIPAYDKFKSSESIGTLKVSPINKDIAKIFIEYMWTNYLIGHRDKVLENTVIEHPDKVQYNLKSVNVIVGDFGLCDKIEVKNFDFYIDKSTGAVTYTSNKIKELKGTCR